MNHSNLCLTAKLYEEYTHRQDSLKPGIDINKVKSAWNKTDKELELSHRILQMLRAKV